MCEMSTYVFVLVYVNMFAMCLSVCVKENVYECVNESVCMW